MERPEAFDKQQIKTVNNSVAMAEELVCNAYKMSVNQWLRHRYDVKTLSELDTEEIVYGRFAQIIRYLGRRKETSLGSSKYDFYKICLQDHAIISALRQSSNLELFPFLLYIATHELIHIVRFSKYLISFDATHKEKIAEENRVHAKTYEILCTLNIPGMKDVLKFHKKGLAPVD